VVDTKKRLEKIIVSSLDEISRPEPRPPDVIMRVIPFPKTVVLQATKGLPVFTKSI
jgi:hypothetical protein